MTSNANHLPKDRKPRPAPTPKRSGLPLILAGGALLVLVVGIAWLTSSRWGMSGSSSPVQATGQPKLTVDREQVDFGRVAVDTPVKALFKLGNTGDQPLQILSQPVVEVKQGC